MKITFERLLLIIILALLLFLAMCKDNNNLYDYLQTQNETIQLEINQLKKLIEMQRDSVIRIDSTIIITKNIYLTKDEEIKQITTDSAAVAVIRNQLKRLRSNSN